MYIDTPQYIFLNRAPGRAWNQSRPESITDALFTQPLAITGTNGLPSLRMGLSFIFSVLDGGPATLSETLHRLLSHGERHDVPLLIVLDGQNWWGARPDLWNWFDSTKPGFDPANIHNVEWTGPTPDTAVKICWRNWGRQIRVVPPPNLYAPRYRKALESTFAPLVNQLFIWARNLPKEKRHLFPGVKIGWEASIGINAYHYTNGNQRWSLPESGDPQTGLQMKQDFAGGVAPLGYAARYYARPGQRGPIMLSDHEYLVQGYLAWLATMTRRVGFARHEIFTHGGGQYAPYPLHYTHKTAVNSDSVPGWSLYGVAPEKAGDLPEAIKAANTNGAWCAAEWLPNAQTASEWAQAYRSTLAFQNCRSVSVYNYETIQNKPDALTGLREVLTRGV